MSNRNILQALQSAGGAGGAGLDVDNVFSTHVYEGNGAIQDISNGINLNTTGTTIGFTTTTLNYFTSSNLGQYGSEEYNLGKIIEDSSGNFYAILRFKNTANSQQQNTITKFSSGGSQVWSYRVQDTGSPQYAEISDILFNSAGNIVVYWMPAGQANYLRINIIDKDTGSILATANNSSGSSNMKNALQSGTSLYWVGETNGKSLFINSDTSPATEVVSRRVDISSYAQRIMLIPQSDNEPVLVSVIADQNSGSSTNGWVFTKLSSNLQSEEFSTRHSHSNGSSTQYSSRYMSPGKQYYDPSDNMLYCLWYGVNSSSGNTSYKNYISKFDMDDGSHVASKSFYFNNNSSGNVDPQSITKFGSSIICVVSGYDGSTTKQIIMEFNSSLTNLNTRTVQLGSTSDRVHIFGGSSSIFYFVDDHQSKAQIVKFSEFDITEPILGVTPATGGVTVTGASLTNTTSGYVDVSPTFNAASDSMGGGSNLTSTTVNLVTSNSVTAAVEEVGTGGLVWSKDRDTATYHNLTDTVRGGNHTLYSSETQDNRNRGNDFITSFNFNGYSIGADSLINDTNSYVSWTFRKQPKFFDIVTWTGNGSSSQNISHNLGSTPGMIICKKYSSTGHWQTGHRYDYSKYLSLNTDNAAATWNGNWTATDTIFTAHSAGNTDYSLTHNGNTYVAYLFAHNDGDGGFGPKGNQDIIKCGSYTGNGNGLGNGPTVDVGFEPQWLLVKNASASGNWTLFDNIRGLGVPTINVGWRDLNPNNSNAEAEGRALGITATGFKIVDDHAELNTNGSTYIYMAIRRGSLNTPEDATKVFGLQNYSGTPSTGPQTGFVTDFSLLGQVTGGDKWYAGSRLTGTKYMQTNTTAAETTNQYQIWDRMDGAWTSAINGYMLWGWKRAPGYFDVVCYEGNGGGSRNITHNLGSAPGMLWLKRRDGSSPYGDWYVQHTGIAASQYIKLNETSAKTTSPDAWNSTYASADVFRVGPDNNVNTYKYIVYLFGTVAGVSKVGSFTGSGSDVTVDCGFSNGARFVLIKDTNATDDWYVYDSVRGIVAGNDGYLELNTTNAESTGADYIDPHSSGFIITAGFMQSGRTYIFYAIA